MISLSLSVLLSASWERHTCWEGSDCVPELSAAWPAEAGSIGTAEGAWALPFHGAAFHEAGGVTGWELYWESRVLGSLVVQQAVTFLASFISFIKWEVHFQHKQIQGMVLGTAMWCLLSFPTAGSLTSLLIRPCSIQNGSSPRCQCLSFCLQDFVLSLNNPEHFLSLALSWLWRPFFTPKSGLKVPTMGTPSYPIFSYLFCITYTFCGQFFFLVCLPYCTEGSWGGNQVSFFLCSQL